MRRRVWKLIAAALVFAAALLTDALITAQGLWWISLALFIVAYLIVGLGPVTEAVRNILHGKVFDENFLMTVATVGAFAVGEYPEAVAVMLFYQLGELFQGYAVNKSRKSIADLMDIRPDIAAVIRDGGPVEVDPYEVKIGETIRVKPGEKIPLDGKVLRGNSAVNTAALTGESLPRDIAPGDSVMSGCINVSGVLEILVEKEFGESTVNKILDLVENASSKKSNSENFITKFAAVYTPIVVVSAVLLAALPPLLVPGQEFSVWFLRALSFLVVSCPCALVISIPLSFFGGIGGASKAGILVKGSNYLEALAKANTIVFDKTGTLTKGVFEVQSIETASMSREELLELAAYAESISDHPISLSVQRAYGKEIDPSAVKEGRELPGHGVSALVCGKSVLAGNRKLMDREGISVPDSLPGGTAVYLACDGVYAGYLLIADSVKEDSGQTIKALKARGIRTVMLTGDAKSVGERVATELGVDEVHCELLPGDKVEKLEALLSGQNKQEKLVFVGDGINDAPVLARADIGIAMGALGSDAAIEAADVVIMTDEPSKIVTAMEISAKTLRIAKQNIVFAIGVKVLVLILAAMGLSNLWEAVFADVGVAVLAILNAMRVLWRRESPKA